MRIALVFPPLYGVDLPPLGIAYVAAKLRHDGHDVRVFCFNSRLHRERPDRRFLWAWENSNTWLKLDDLDRHFDIKSLVDEWAHNILAFKPSVVGFSVNTHSRLVASLLARQLKAIQTDIKVIYGGPFCTEGFDARCDIDRNVDVYIKGEGEITVSAVVARLSRKEPLSGIQGIIVTTDGGYQDTGNSCTPADVDALPFPALDLFNFDDYDNKREIPILFSRGCNFYCRFCCDRPMWGRYRMRSAQNIAAEIKAHKQAFGRSAFKCNDLLVNGDLPELSRLTAVLMRENLDVTWGGMARARAEMSPDLLYQMKKAGCAYLTFGIESGSNKILKFMGKPSVVDVRRALSRTHKAGIKVNTLWMVGHPHETFLDVLKTILFLLRNRGSIDEFVAVSACYIPKSSLLYQQARNLKIDYDAQGQWFIKSEGNTFTKRQKRAVLLQQVARRLGLYYGGIGQGR